MQQAKISAFFKPVAPATPPPQPPLSAQIESWDLPGAHPPGGPVTYKRRRAAADPVRGDDEIQSNNNETVQTSLKCKPTGKILNKKRSYAQYHLELGQSDFLLRSCSVCGLMYAPGDEEDEKVHNKYHKDYIQGIQFKGWQKERVVSTLCSNADRIVLVLDGDPAAQKNKVESVVRVVERELGFSDGQLLHKHCKVYLYISSHRIVGCLVAEPIRTGHRVIFSSSCSSADDAHTELSSELKVGDKDFRRPNPTVLRFGNFSFQREAIKKGCPLSKCKTDHWDGGAILCEEESVPALCGIRAIWVVPSKRRKGIASRLLDAARTSFCLDRTLEASQFAFSPPTSDGKALASRYIGSNSFLVYRAEDVV